MTPSRSTSSVPTSEAPVSQKRVFSKRLIACIGIMLAVLLVAGITFATKTLSFSHAAASLGKKADNDAAITTINGLKKITMVDKTDQIIDAHGKTITVDPNPYGIAISDG